MMIHEFIEKTNLYPSDELYKAIEDAYNDFGGDKNAFCKAYLSNTDGLAAKIAQAADKHLTEERSDSANTIDGLVSRIAEQKEDIARLEDELDRLLEWNPCRDVGTKLPEADYKKLAASPGARAMTDKEAANFIAEELGFAVNRIRIIHTVETFEINRRHELRLGEKYEREPINYATDWNYVRFDVNGFEYEYVDGQLFLYCR